MILKKPYGFLIKHFKIINLVLLIPIIYITLSFGDISSFYRRYVNNNFITLESGMAGRYITIWLLAAIVFMILVNIIIYMLMKKKKKKTTFYILSILYFFILFITAMVSYNSLTSIEMAQVNTTNATFMKDLVGFTPLPGYVIAVITFFKGIGFNIKTLKFDQNIDLQVTDEDNEEIEIGTNSENISYKKTVTHIIRELKYYVLENKFIFICLVALLFMILASNIYLNFQVYNKKYSIKQELPLNNIRITMLDSYITNTDIGGNVINKDKYFIAIKMQIKNSEEKNSISVEEKDLRIRINKKDFYPSFDRGSNFIDIGKNYLGQKIPPQDIEPINKPTFSCEKGYKLVNGYCKNDKETIDAIQTDNFSCPDNYEMYTNKNKEERCKITDAASTFVIVYEIDKEQIKNSYELKILEKSLNDIGELNPTYRIIKFKPKNLLNKEDLGELDTDKEYKLTKTLLNNTTIKISNIKFVNYYNYVYDYCKKENECTKKLDVITTKSGRKLMIIDDEINYDKETSYYRNSNLKFYEDFGKIQYKLNNKTFTSQIKDVTPKNLVGKRIYEVPMSVTNGKELVLILSFRNNTISINI